MDNLKPHKTAGVREAIEAAPSGSICRPGGLYSPDLNPIEQAIVGAPLSALSR